jgi:GntR family transcriptional regulator
MFTADDQKTIDASLPVPLYHQLYTLLRHKIESGECARDALLPGEAELTRVFGVSRITARRALEELRRGGLVRRERGIGTTVTFAGNVRPGLSTVQVPLEKHPDEDRAGQLELLEFGRIAATASVAALLKLPMGAPVDRSLHLLHADGQPYARELSYSLPAAGAAGRADRPGSRLQMLLHRGIELAEVEQLVGAVCADAAVARQLRVPVGAALVSVARTALDGSGRPIEHVLSYYRTDRVRLPLRIRLKRTGFR